MDGDDINLKEALDVAVDAARKAGRIMWSFYQYRREDAAAKATKMLKNSSDDKNNRNSGGADDGDSKEERTHGVSELLGVETKSSYSDLVTRYDKLCDETIMKTIQQYTTRVEREKHDAGFASFHFDFITEEICPDKPLTDAPTWVVDPIDGTMSFVHGACDCCVSIGLTIHRRTVLAVIYCPFISAPLAPLTSVLTPMAAPAGELYTAIRGEGAFLNGRPIRMQDDVKPKRALVNFGYPMRPCLSRAEQQQYAADPEKGKQEKHKKMIHAAAHIRRQLTKQPVQGVRSYGACALVLAMMAAGRIDLYMEPSGKIWDVCAGSLLVTEAGGVVKNLSGGEFGMEGMTTIIAAANEDLCNYGVELCNEVQYEHFWMM
ncbi:putative Inositol monophosphatase family [Trypanosoma vivax]|uniref:Inositol-1-monophosphatase n=1 Tax=Trypanosoma vivax (strain Y486) TaxID=1055687 RepID=G0U2B2_TRYVY|nr:putative myo-inositol-1 phosphatase [Trypanosoma vivax]KAH8611994.1 putative Inositol monophosphatase family [Trypanosoma vivax]KAH8620793.1 putative Inositol monophosphatase family [Trypanosoma vivax]CCC50415.1 putative myo-inositol-1 phosphatase [Trypanosoma vivax Y486]